MFREDSRNRIKALGSFLPVRVVVPVVHGVDLADVLPVDGSLVRLVLVNHLSSEREMYFELYQEIE